VPDPDSDFERRLRTALETAARPADPIGVKELIEHRIMRRRRRARLAVAVAAIVVVAGAAIGIATTRSTNRQRDRVATSVPRHFATAPAAAPNLSPRGSAALSTTMPPSESHPAPPAAPCPTNAAVPSMATGRYCGPLPHPGNGLGAQGECTGRETDPPCGPGVVPGRYYAYTLPGTCDGLIVFDGRRWVSELPPPTPQPDRDVWMTLTLGTRPNWISPAGAVSFLPYAGQTLPTCGQ
jgi:hypothetical protein